METTQTTQRATTDEAARLLARRNAAYVAYDTAAKNVALAAARRIGGGRMQELRTHRDATRAIFIEADDAWRASVGAELYTTATAVAS